MLHVKGLTVRYGSVQAVDGADLRVPDGAVLALLGPSGCGKSTLLRAVAGLEPAAAGTVCWDGVDLARIPVHRRGFGLMFQDGVLFPNRTVAGNIGYGLRRRPDGTALSSAARTAHVAELLEMVGLAGYGPRRVSTLSGGEAQRVALARALAPRPRLLLLDEPLAALDRGLREQLLADLRGVLAATRTTAIFVTHDQREAFAVADQVALMRAGAIVQTGSPRQVWSRPLDPWVATFLGCGSVLPARPRQEPDGSWCSVTALGSVPGRAELVGLRPEALVVDARGLLRGVVVAAMPGPERQRVTVRLVGEGADGRLGGDGAGGRVVGDGAGAVGEMQAVAHRDQVVVVGQTVGLVWNPEGAALIGADGDAGMPPGREMPPGRGMPPGPSQHAPGPLPHGPGRLPGAGGGADGPRPEIPVESVRE